MTIIPELPGPNSQHLLSVKYVAPSRCIIPTTDPNLWGLFVGIGGERKCLGILTTEELLTSFHEDWTAAVTAYNKPEPVYVPAAPIPSVSQTDLDDILSDLTLDF